MALPSFHPIRESETVMSMLKRFGRKLAAFGAIAATACAAPAAEPKAANPAMWKVADSDTTIYLFGTIHLLPPGTKWRTATIDRAAASSDTLVVETIFDDAKPDEIRATMRRMAESDGLPPLAARVSPGKRAALAAALAKLGARPDAFDKYETWFAGFTLLGLQFAELGLAPGSGVEPALKKQFSEQGKPLDQLETNAEQLSYLDGLSEEAQRKFLEGVLDDPASMKQQFGGMLQAWTRGDVKAIAESFNSDLADADELKNALLLKRNANWTRWVKGRLDRPGTVMVAVGAGHLAGDGSVVSMLEKQGVKVTRVQ